MKKHGFKLTALALALVMIFALCACGDSGAPATGGGGSSTPDAGQPTAEPGNSGGSDDGKVYQLSLSTHDPATSNKTAFHQEWADRINEASGGRIEVTVYSAGSLAGGTGALDAMRTGACDIAWVYPAYFPGQFPLSEVLTLPLGFDSVPQAASVLWDLYESEEALQAELAEFVPIMMHSNPSNIIASIEKYPISSMADVSGLKFRASAGAASDLLIAWGATPMQMGPGDIFQAIEKGTVEGYIFDYSGIISFSLQEVTANYTDMAVYLGPYYLLMNKSSFDALPQDLQQVILDNSTREVSLEMGYIFEADELRSKQLIIDAGGNIIPVSAEDEAEFKAASQTLLDNWIATNDSSDFDAQAFVDKAAALAAQYHIDRDDLNATLKEMGLVS